MLKKKIFNIAIYNKGKYSARLENKITPVYQIWYGMIKRAYSEKFHTTHPSYIDCEVCKEWLDFQTFAEWFNENYIEGYALDKDLLIKGNKIYSPNTCCFIPQEINSLLTKSNSTRGEYPIGVSKFKNSYRASINIKGKQKIIKQCKTVEEAFDIYKETKENYIKIVANKYKNIIDKKAYDTLHSYQVETTD